MMAASQNPENDNETRGRAAAALDAARDRTLSAYETARTRSRETAQQVTDQLSVYPVGAVIGGLVVGGVLAFLLPRTERENRLLGPTARKLAGAAREAAQKGLDAGREQVQTLTGDLGGKVGRAVAEAVSTKD
jgi:ElaB/YqjD/DUF883 family membrane-anchored ribosome-binding protein